MSLAEFSIIVAIDSANGIAKDGELPWNSPEDMRYFRDTTIGRGKNLVIMGRVTYESIPEDFRPLPKRDCAVVSTTWKQEDHQGIMVYPSLDDALVGVGAMANRYDEIFIIGGESIYTQALTKYMYLCKKVHVTKFKLDYKCDQHFDFDAVSHFPLAQDPTKSRDYTRYIYNVNIVHDEVQYIEAVKFILDNGESKSDRTGVGTISVFGRTMLEFDISNHLPIITTKKTFYNGVIRELLFFISGKTDTKILEESKVKIWAGNTSKEYLKDHNLPYREGDMGPSYPHSWRHWGAEYEGCDKDYTGLGIDQLSQLINGIRTNPFSRRHILCNWHVGHVDQMVLPPCHILAQFNVSGDKRYLDCLMYQRSADMFLGVPFNITSYCILTYMIAHICGLKPRRFVLTIGDAHIYNNHINVAKRMIARTPKPFPTLTFRSPAKLQEIDDFNFDSFIIQGYTSWPTLSAEMAV